MTRISRRTGAAVAADIGALIAQPRGERRAFAPQEPCTAGVCSTAMTAFTSEQIAICDMLNAANSFGAKVRDAGTADQKDRFLRPVSSGEALGCLLMTEPHAG